MSAQTVFVKLEGPANALATNRDTSLVAVAGRNVFKIFNIEQDKFIEKVNLRVGKNLNLNFSCADVVWHPTDDNILATAATNGSVVTWNLNKSSHSKLDMVFNSHKRTVNKVCFHSAETNILLSGSQDGTMKMYDLRKKEHTSTFYSLSESVRDVQFCPHQYFTFTAVQENGNVQFWDLRRTDRFEKQFTAHSGPVFTCDWHPEVKTWLATAGRDKAIKVWDTSSKPYLEHCIQTMASVSRVKWRPQKKHNIASCSLVVDFTVNVWSIKRPYVPFASFTEHKDVTTGFAWRNNPDILLTTSKDCTLYQHYFDDSIRPAEQANPSALAVNPSGSVCYAASDKIISELSANLRNSTSSLSFFKLEKQHPTTIFRKQQQLPPPVTPKDPSDEFESTSSMIKNFHHVHRELSMDWFVECALNYQLCGKSLSEVCDHNSSVAWKLQRHHVAITWLIIKVLYTTNSSLMSEYSSNIDKITSGDKNIETSLEGASAAVVATSSVLRNHHNNGKRGSRHVSGECTQDATEDDSDSANTDHESTITNIANELAQGEFFYGDGEMDTYYQGMEYSQPKPTNGEWTLPQEAINYRHILGDGSPPPESEPPNSSLYPYVQDQEKYYSATDIEGPSRWLAASSLPSYPPWNFSGSIVETLRFYADRGDVQMTVTVLLVLGNKVKDLIDEPTQEYWFHSYIDLLSSMQLYNVANQVIKLCQLRRINGLNQQSTVVNTVCGACKKSMAVAGWYCTHCKKRTKCSLCHQVVHGLYVWCQGCGHGGHVQHMKEWFKEFRQCPSGCGHACEYT